jgi:hypothetical protein
MPLTKSKIQVFNQSYIPLSVKYDYFHANWGKGGIFNVHSFFPWRKSSPASEGFYRGMNDLFFFYPGGMAGAGENWRLAPIEANPIEAKGKKGGNIPIQANPRNSVVTSKTRIQILSVTLINLNTCQTDC